MTSVALPPDITTAGFEGPEKVLEIWFSPPRCSSSPLSSSTLVHFDSSPTDPTAPNIFCDPNGTWSYAKTGLRTVPVPVWDDMLTTVKAVILSSIHNEHCDAYLLSESSFFVYPNRIILKTCGTTTLLRALGKIMSIAAEYAEMDRVEALFYSRKAYYFPDKQLYPHARWDDEILYLEQCIPDLDTAAYTVGKMNTADHWCLFVATPKDEIFPISPPSTIASASDDDDSSSLDLEIFNELDNVTLEIMMSRLDPQRMKAFWKQPGDVNCPENGPNRISVSTGIADIYPGSQIDDHIFDPCGYSMNGLLGKYYWTIHVTPEDHCSYASFETSIPVRSLVDDPRLYQDFQALVSKVIDIFNPDTFSVNLFTRCHVFKKYGYDLFEPVRPKADFEYSYRMRDRIVHGLGQWEVVFMHYDKKVKSNPSHILALKKALKKPREMSILDA